ncbi:MAG: GDSL-type esterase/lipase family protein [Opitutales bacterium]
MLRRTLAFLALVPALLFADKPEPRVLFLGDSITFGGGWVVNMESAIRAQKGMARATIVNLGLSSETASGLSEPGHAGGAFPRPDVHERLERAVRLFRPTLAFVCYGMNDGIYMPLDRVRFDAYRNGMIRLNQALVAARCRVVFITPSLFSVDDRAKDPLGYDAVLDAYAAWLVERRADGWTVADIRPRLREQVAGARALDPKFVYARDRIHPGEQGHRFMAKAAWETVAPALKWNPHVPFAEGEKLAVLRQEMTVLRDAWLRHVGHRRPGVPAGLPLEQAEERARGLLEDYLAK